jgi:hypothetical protein
MYPIGTVLEEGKVAMPSTIPTTVEKFTPDGIYIIDTNAYIFIYIMKEVDPQLLQ